MVRVTPGHTSSEDPLKYVIQQHIPPTGVSVRLLPNCPGPIFREGRLRIRTKYDLDFRFPMQV